MDATMEKKITKILDKVDYIGVRDNFTQEDAVAVICELFQEEANRRVVCKKKAISNDEILIEKKKVLGILHKYRYTQVDIEYIIMDIEAL